MPPFHRLAQPLRSRKASRQISPESAWGFLLVLRVIVKFAQVGCLLQIGVSSVRLHEFLVVGCLEGKGTPGDFGVPLFGDKPKWEAPCSFLFGG